MALGFNYSKGVEYGAKWANEQNKFECKTQKASADIALGLLTNEIQASERSEKVWQRRYDSLLNLANKIQEERQMLSEKAESLSAELDTERLKYSLAVSMVKSLQNDVSSKHDGGTVDCEGKPTHLASPLAK